MIKWKRSVGLVAVAAGIAWLLSVATWAWTRYAIGEHVLFVRMLHPDHPVYNGFVEERLRSQGGAGDLQAALAALPKRWGVLGYVLTDGELREVLAADSPGTRERFAPPSWEVPREDKSGFSYYVQQPPDEVLAHARPVEGPDGTTYYLVALYRPLSPIYQKLYSWTIRLGIAAFLLAWVALAVWIALDAAERRIPAAPAWGLLGLLSGPVGLGTYLIVRPVPEPCPGCGEVLDPGGAFCPFCGHALRPACPGCRQPVAHTWNYCRACGTPLTGD
ncbi:MAG: zinc ribbon domain-containing protein [Firmicutes bacterium]|nr:zinc ribbon domain-containing protein [Bacillota bacterium]